MKRFLITLTLGLVVAIGSFAQGVFAAQQVSVSISKSDKTVTTKRIHLGSGQSITVLVANYWNSKHNLKYTVFKNGKAHISGLAAPNEVKNNVFKASSWGAGDYSIRLYCGKYETVTGCGGQASLTVK
ncbi:hypothetical protein MXL46_19000 [Heyndrickxia sporothermodurans]|uniref:hypothetical protein n=1 Tax=Heyndrickxia sporothermodurans TaxID=46224 RepID=UPI002DBAE1F9|nr:hypothetical protein [Heyndrickxia sporothermodurans]MEB6551136.1 hypothetical protein [Heyndrickxia sporothermodurans]